MFLVPCLYFYTFSRPLHLRIHPAHQRALGPTLDFIPCPRLTRGSVRLLRGPEEVGNVLPGVELLRL